MAFTGTALRTAKLDLTLLGCESLITCSPLVRLGDKDQTIISARISNGDPDLDLTGWVMGFEATVGEKLIRDEDQSRFRLVGKNTVEYKCSDEVHSFIGTANVAYFTLKKDGTTVTTQNFTIHSLSNAETGTTGLKEHYVSVIDDLVKSNGEVMGKAEEIKNLIEKNQVVKKSGDTVTGNIDMDTSVGSKSKGYRWRDATGALFGLESATDGALILYDYKNLARVWQYDPVAKRFTVLSDTNLLKTTGGTITGTTIFEAGDLRFKNAANDILFRNNTSGIFSFYDIAQNQVVWSYNPATKEFTVNSASNLLKKTGDTMTGPLNGTIFNVANEIMFTNAGTGRRSRLFMDNTNGTAFTIVTEKTAGKADWDWGNHIRVGDRRNWLKNTGDTLTGDLTIKKDGASLNFSTVGGSRNARIFYNANEASDSGLNIQTPNGKLLLRDGSNITREVATKEKDGRANPTLTADAENPNSGAPLIVERRGNTVTVSGSVRRKVGASGDTIATLPADMRPSTTQRMNLLATDGAVVFASISSVTGNLALSSTGKEVYMQCTYVAD